MSSERETENGYEKTFKQEGRLIHEEWNSQSKHGEYSVVLGDRFTVADICVASVIAWVEGASELMAQCPQVRDWLQGCLARPAFQQVRYMAQSA